ncbi:hypothetical protein C8A00DRAFT_44734 [Chaetomidium leptoderma]|uniref:CFEM domain-containing protein n=1 Tax=Chaetomidium leptoderma TaxID=669021 RepID=A0AAN6VKR6_9PEZI|nr:hypothetical protein C8A00DRAFT_44734 [Chaetomidium leptoderma]
MLSTTKVVAGFLLATAGALAHDPRAAMVTPVPSCGGNPCSEFVSAVPACATGCIESAASQVGCAHDDYSCQCVSSGAIQATAINCVLGGCGADAFGVIGAVGSMCSCVTANPTTPCTESTSTSTIDVITTTTIISSSSKPTPTPVCPSNECSFPSPAEHECVAGCIDAVLPEFGCNELEDWNCFCNNFRKISNRAFKCAYACGTDVYSAFNGPASKGCTCLLEECKTPPSSSSSSSTQPSTTTMTPLPSSTITTAPECPHPCAPSITAIPTCATSCIVSAASAVGCGGSDFDCRCSSSAAIQASAVGCVVGACGIDEALKVVDAVGTLCSCVTASPTTACDFSSTSPASLPSTRNDDAPETTTTDEPCTETTTSSSSSSSNNSFPPTTTTTTDDEPPCTDDEPEETTSSSSNGGSSFPPTTTRTGDDSGDDDDDGRVTEPPGSGCTAGCDGGGDNGEGGGGIGEGGGGSSGSGPSPTTPPPAGSGGGGGGGSTSTTPKPPPVATAGASSFVLAAGTGCLAAVIAAAVAVL